MQLKERYVAYLQQRLRDSGVEFEEEVQFMAREEKREVEKEEEGLEKTPLETNLVGPLTGMLVQRYSRQMLLKEIAYDGQVKVMKARVALVGAGGIGCPLALYLSASGVGTIGLFDSDTVDVTNLHRQIGHRTSTVGLPKTQSLKNTILSINPHIKVNEHPFITAFNANLLDDYDLVIDGSDNPTCRYIVNDHCMKNNRKLLSGACIGWQAQITCYGGESPCYRCLWGNDQMSLGGCSTLGVIGMLPGLVGLILATEALKMILTGSSSLEGKLLTYDGRRCEFKKRELRKKQPNCIACGMQKLKMEQYDYAKYNSCQKNPVPETKQTSWSQFIEKDGQHKLLLDVRPTNHYNIVHFTNSINIPFESLNKMPKQQILSKLNLQPEAITEPISVSCTRGIMSRHAVSYLQSIGLPATSITGGILGYKAQFDSLIPQI